MSECFDSWGDPGPCPVDDAPHHTCTSPDYRPGPIVAGHITPATSVDVPAPAIARPTPARTEQTFSAVTYRREVHGREARTRAAVDSAPLPPSKPSNQRSPRR